MFHSKSAIRCLTEVECSEAVGTLVHWRLDETGKAIHRGLRFPDFATAFAFMTRVALAAERMDHHPDWSNSHGRVLITLTTRDADGVTGRDLNLARAIDDIAAAMGAG